jgi:hypothetical protein
VRGTAVAEGEGMMTTKMALVGTMVLGASFFLAGCTLGCDPGNNTDRTPVTFTPSSTDATRSCSSYQMKLLGDTTGSAPYTLIEIDIAASAALGQDVPLWVDASETTAHSSDNSVAFSIQAGSKLDDFALTSVVVTPYTLPTTDGNPMTVGLQLTFQDGRKLDTSYTAPMTTEGQCGI